MVKDYRPMADGNRPMADCEKTSRLIGFADVLPMIGSPLVAGGLSVLGIGNLDGESEEKIFMGNEDGDSEKKTYLREIATEVVDRFVVNFNCINPYLSKIRHTFHLLSQIRLQHIDI